jgi:hypothetical protein
VHAARNKYARPLLRNVLKYAFAAAARKRDTARAARVTSSSLARRRRMQHADLRAGSRQQNMCKVYDLTSRYHAAAARDNENFHFQWNLRCFARDKSELCTCHFNKRE